MASKGELVDQTINLLERYAKCISNDDHLQNKEEIFEKLQNQVAYYVTAKETHKKTDEVFNNFTQNLEDMSDVDSKQIVKDYKRLLTEELKKVGDPQDNRRYKEFLQIIQEKDPNASDIMTVSESLNFIDPISKKPIVDPVKNKNCGHSYEKSTILELISKNPNLRCPMVGCRITSIKKSDLVDDPEFKRQIEKQQQQQLTQGPNKSESRIVLDESDDGSNDEN